MSVGCIQGANKQHTSNEQHKHTLISGLHRALLELITFIT